MKQEGVFVPCSLLEYNCYRLIRNRMYLVILRASIKLGESLLLLRMGE